MKYFKILNDNMSQHGFTYHEGLNTDVNEFNKVHIDAEHFFNAGLFFCNAENILSYADYGTLLAEVELPEGEYVTPGNGPTEYKAHSIILKNIRPLWKLETFQYLVREGAKIHIDDDWALCVASENGCFDIVRFLVENNANIEMLPNAVQCAAIHGHLDIIKYLIKNGANICANKDQILWASKMNNQQEVVKYLLKYGIN